MGLLILVKSKVYFTDQAILYISTDSYLLTVMIVIRLTYDYAVIVSLLSV